LIFEKLHLAGRDPPGYELGEPMLVHDRGRFLGSLDPIEVSADRSDVHISRFLPSPSLGSERRNFGPLLLVEVTLFLVERFPSIQTVCFTLTREIEMYGEGMMVAAARSELLRSIGATDVHVRAKPDSSRPGNFVVQGVWPYTEHNLGALRAALDTQRAIYREHLGRVREDGPPVRLLRRLKHWWTRDDET
jgi:hypothetical protein